MKKWMKGLVFLMALSTWAQLLAGCKTWTGEKPDKPEMPDKIVSLPDIQELTYYKHGTMMEPIWSVSLIRQEEKAAVRINPWDSQEEEPFEYPADPEVLEEARRILEMYDVASWGGFRGSDPNVLDGYSMSFCVSFTDGTSLEASGENKSPKNCRDVFGALDDLTEEARSAYYSQIK